MDVAETFSVPSSGFFSMNMHGRNERPLQCLRMLDRYAASVQQPPAAVAPCWSDPYSGVNSSGNGASGEPTKARRQQQMANAKMYSRFQFNFMHLEQSKSIKSLGTIHDLETSRSSDGKSLLHAILAIPTLVASELQNVVRHNPTWKRGMDTTNKTDGRAETIHELERRVRVLGRPVALYVFTNVFLGVPCARC